MTYVCGALSMIMLTSLDLYSEFSNYCFILAYQRRQQVSTFQYRFRGRCMAGFFETAHTIMFSSDMWWEIVNDEVHIMTRYTGQKLVEEDSVLMERAKCSAYEKNRPFDANDVSTPHIADSSIVTV